MLRLLNTFYYKVFKSKSFWFLIISSFICTAGMMIIGKLMTVTRYDASGNASVILPSYNMFFGVQFGMTFIPSIALAILASCLIGSEYSNGTVRNKLTTGHRRSDVYLATLLVNISIGIMLILCLLPSIFCLGAVYYKRARLEFITANDTNIQIDLSHDQALNASIEIWNRALNNLRLKQSELKLVSRELTESITNISHDLRTPLAAISGYIQLMQMQKLPQKIAEYLSIIAERCLAMCKLTEELFAYTLAANAPEFETQSIDINALLENCLTKFYQPITDSKLDVSVDIESTPCLRNVCLAHIERIFENLITNAVKYSGGDLIVKSNGGIITFTNRAPNLSNTDAGKLFNRFFTVQSASNKSTGLGLAIAQMLAHRNNATLTSDIKNGNLTKELKLQ